MDDVKRITLLDNAVEAGALSAMLEEKKIPHTIRSYHDAAFDGVFQPQKGWGCVEAPELYEAEILRLLGQLRDEAQEREESGT